MLATVKTDYQDSSKVHQSSRNSQIHSNECPNFSELRVPTISSSWNQHHTKPKPSLHLEIFANGRGFAASPTGVIRCSHLVRILYRVSYRTLFHASVTYPSVSALWLHRPANPKTNIVGARVDVPVGLRGLGLGAVAR